MFYNEPLTDWNPTETNPNQDQDNSSRDNSSRDNVNNNSNNFTANFYNPFEVKHRKRTSRAQFKVLEKHFNKDPKPKGSVRQALAKNLGMTPRGIQIWFQNRRAKQKNVVKAEKDLGLSIPQQQQREQRQPNSQDILFELPTFNMLHSRSQSSSTSSTNKPWMSDNSTVNDEEEEFSTLNTPPNNQSSQFLLELAYEQQENCDGTMVPFINHQTVAAEIKPECNTTSNSGSIAALNGVTADGPYGGDAGVNLNAWPENYDAQPCLPMTSTNGMISHEFAMRSLPINGVTCWVQSRQPSNDYLLDSLFHANCSECINKRSFCSASQDETYRVGQQFVRLFSDPLSELQLMNSFNNYSAMRM